jgi:hypothetical protein
MGCNCGNNKNKPKASSGGITPLHQRLAQQSPGWTEVLREFTGAMIKWAKSGLGVVDSKTHSQRYGICTGCDQLKNHRCVDCGCIVYIKSKLESESCPLKKW